MLEFCNTAVAMGNGSKEIADIITDDVDRDGLYKVFKELKLT